MSVQDHYQTLGILPGASLAEVRDAYRDLMRLHHPDSGATDGGARAAAINEAYRCLSDPAARSLYDRQHNISATALRPMAGRSQHSGDNGSMGTRSSPDEPGVAGLPIKWIAILSALLMLPLAYGIWINGY